MGGRPRGVGDYSELLVARAIGRDLTKREGCLVQLMAIILFAGIVYWFFTSGLYFDFVRVFVEWYGKQIKLSGA